MSNKEIENLPLCLLAAAPAMLEALICLTKALDGPIGDAICTCDPEGTSDETCPITKAEVAILLAKGESHV